FVFVRLEYRWLAGVHWLLYGLGILSLGLVLLFGHTVNGTRGWFEILGFQLQPVEFVKIIMAVVLAKFFSDRSEHLDEWGTIGLSGLLVGVPVGLIMAQPDLGSAVILVGMWVGVLLAMPVPRRMLLTLAAAGAVVAVISWIGVLQPYQKNRLLNFVSPGRDRLGSGYNVQQAMTAVGSGQWVGRGLGLGPQSQLNFLPERHTDFIFASIAEELGLVGAVTILILFGLLFWRIYRLAQASRDNFSILFATVVAMMFFIQVAINIGMNIGLFPVTGIPLPLISYGGSSLLACLMTVGLLESLAIRQRTLPL
ncbi:MAG: rod shape-determining protein RodA, partial [Candidatus Kerfeldbacteria bacterium]|nr:rod shape-determining protein RodA [Candidatus Kerfeldbacteria bacterium]